MTISSVGGNTVIDGDILVRAIAYKPTAVTVTSWSYVTTTITLNVASHTFLAGDYIEVAGLTATTNVPNGVHLVTSVTATTIVFTYALTPTGTAGVSSATVKGYITTNGRVESIGVGQTWQDVTASRVAGTTYTNSTGKPIVCIFNPLYNSAFDCIISLNGLEIGRCRTPTIGVFVPFTLIVPNGGKYSFSSTLTSMYELR